MFIVTTGYEMISKTLGSSQQTTTWKERPSSSGGYCLCDNRVRHCVGPGQNGLLRGFIAKEYQDELNSYTLAVSNQR